jgi:esterase/lipase
MSQVIQISKTILFLLLTWTSVSSAIETDRWFSQKLEKSKGVILLMHGFNVKPSKMDTLGSTFASWGYDVYRPALSGHRERPGEMIRTSASQWVEETFRALMFIATLSKHDTPVFFVGLSMNGLILNELLQKHPEARRLIRKSVLISPAFAFRMYAQSPRLMPFLEDSFPLFSEIREYDADFVTYGTFRSLLGLYDRNISQKLKYLTLPTLIFLHPKDAVINASKVMRLKDEFHMPTWQFVVLPATSDPEENTNRHMLIDEKTAGPHAWRTILDRTRKFLEH